MTSDTAVRLAALHARAAAPDRGWSAKSFRSALSGPHAALVESPCGFALGQCVLDEAELHMIAVLPELRRSGRGRDILARFEALVRGRGARHIHLEVAADNAAARALYAGAGYAGTGARPGYYRRAGRAPTDALMLSKSLRLGDPVRPE